MAVILAETSVAEPCVEYFRGLDWEVFQEVEAAGGRCDIVARRGPVIWTIEAKTSMSMAVMEQAANWIPASNYSAIVVPGNVHARRGHFAFRVCEMLGIGILHVDATALKHGRRGAEVPCAVVLEPKLHRKRNGMIERFLREEQKDWSPAGSASGGHYTPFQGVARVIAAQLASEPAGLILAELMTRIDKQFRYHYGKAPIKRNVVRWLDNGYIKHVRVEREGKVVRVFWKKDDDAPAK